VSVVNHIFAYKLSGAATTEALKKLAKRFAKHYPRQEMMTSMNVTINTTGGAAMIEQTPGGCLVKSTDQADIVFVFLDGVAAARLAAYCHRQRRQHRCRCRGSQLFNPRSARARGRRALITQATAECGSSSASFASRRECGAKSLLD
jgi:hypothetical protein